MLLSGWLRQGQHQGKLLGGKKCGVQGTEPPWWGSGGKSPWSCRIVSLTMREKTLNSSHYYSFSSLSSPFFSLSFSSLFFIPFFPRENDATPGLRHRQLGKHKTLLCRRCDSQPIRKVGGVERGERWWATAAKRKLNYSELITSLKPTED